MNGARQSSAWRQALAPRRGRLLSYFKRPGFRHEPRVCASSSLYGRPAAGNPYDYFGKIDKEMVVFLQNVADQTVRKSHGQP